jgi:hypothetical protein
MNNNPSKPLQPKNEILIKTVRRIFSNAELARAFADILRTPTHEHEEIFCAEYAKKIGNAYV